MLGRVVPLKVTHGNVRRRKGDATGREEVVDLPQRLDGRGEEVHRHVREDVREAGRLEGPRGAGVATGAGGKGLAVVDQRRDFRVDVGIAGLRVEHFAHHGDHPW